MNTSGRELFCRIRTFVIEITTSAVRLLDKRHRVAAEQPYCEPTPSLRRKVIIGHHSVNADWSKFRPANAANKNQ
jgi:hypothetical protein